MTTPGTQAAWDELGGIDGVEHGLTATILSSGPFNFPSIAEQDRTHGAGLPEVDRGPEPLTVVG